MSAYWCAEGKHGEVLAEGFAGEWPLTDSAVSEAREGDEAERQFKLAMDVYSKLVKLRPDGGEIPWSELPDSVRHVSAFSTTPAIVCVSF